MRVRINKKHLGIKYKLLYFILIISVLIYMSLPLIIPIESSAQNEGNNVEGCIETNLGDIFLRSSCYEKLKIGDIVPLEIYIQAENIYGLKGRINYDNTIFEDLEESDIEVRFDKWSLNSLIRKTNSAGDFRGYTFDMSEIAEDSEGASNFILCIINLKVKKAIDTTQVVIDNVNLTDINGNDTISEDALKKSTTLNIPTNLKKYNIIYNANTEDTTVVNMPNAEQKLQGTLYTISSTIPTRTGYAFKEWNTKADGTGTIFESGKVYNIDENLELYAQWEEIKMYNVTYNANVGDDTVANMPQTEQKAEKVDYKISPTIPTRRDYKFKGWNTKSDGTGTSYNPESIYNVDESLELYAIWEKESASEKLYLSSKPYKIGNKDVDNYEVGDKYISKVVKETTKTNFIYNLDTNGKIRILKEDKTELKDGELVGTGMTLEVTKDQEKIQLKIAVLGDVSGDGKVTVTDLSTINQTVLDVVKLENEYKIAADLDENDKVTVTDLSTENKMILGLVK